MAGQGRYPAGERFQFLQGSAVRALAKHSASEVVVRSVGKRKCHHGQAEYCFPRGGYVETPRAETGLAGCPFGTDFDSARLRVHRMGDARDAPTGSRLRRLRE